MRGEEEVALRIAFQAALEVVTDRGFEAVRDADVGIGLAVAVHIIEPRDLVAAEHEHRVVGDHQTQQHVEPRRDPSPADGLKRGVEPLHPPDVPLGRADCRVPIREEADAPKKEQRLPRVVERRPDRVDGVGAARAGRAAGGEDLRPLAGAALEEVGQRMAVGRSDVADEFAVLHPRGVERLDLADTIREDHPFAVAIEAVIDERLAGLLHGGRWFDEIPGGRGRSAKAIPRW